MARYLLRVMYDGAAFQGWQTQCAGRSIQGDLISAFRRIGVKHPGLTGSGRTDAGVHALSHFSHFDYRGNMSPRQIMLALNNKLEPDLLVMGIWPVPDIFHARFQAMSRSYTYLLAKEQTPLNRLNMGWLPRRNITLPALSSLAEALQGKHDFTSLSKDNPGVPNHLCDLWQLDILERRAHFRFDISADRFLHNMVRRIVGTLVNLAHQELGADYLRDILAQQNARQRHVLTAPACGLYLTAVRYPDLQLDETPLPESW